MSFLGDGNNLMRFFKDDRGRVCGARHDRMAYEPAVVAVDSRSNGRCQRGATIARFPANRMLAGEEDSSHALHVPEEVVACPLLTNP
jgi:hypothetical protein